MSHQASDKPDGTGPDEQVFAAKSLRLVALAFMAGAVVLGLFALALGLSSPLQARLGLEPTVAREVGLALGGVAVLAFVAVAWELYRELRWVAVSRDGIRWHHNRQVHARGWDAFAGLQRNATKTYVNGKHISTTHATEVRFHTGEPFIISPLTVREYEALIAAIEDGARRWGGTGRPAGPDELDPADLAGPPSFGPLRLDPHGVEWDGVYRPWEQVQSYEVAHGYLLIQAADGGEFLRRLADLGDWRPALARLDAAVGAKRVESPAAT